jgi:uncharacterized protein (TIGR03435 family)
VRILLATAGAIVAIVTVVGAQARPDTLSFEVASIRRNTLGGPGKKIGDPPTPVGTGGVLTPQGDTWRAQNATVRTLIRFAYGSDGDLSTPALLEDFRVTGGPSWFETEAYDIVAKMPDTPRATGDSALMLRALLADRFALRLHSEIRELRAYELVRAEAGNTRGNTLHRAAGTCVSRRERTVRDQRPCGVRRGFEGLMADGVSMAQLAHALAPLVGRPVVDRTDLVERFDFQLRFGSSPDSRFPSIFTALQEQLGLRLASTRAPVQVLVIDSVRRPTDN